MAQIGQMTGVENPKLKENRKIKFFLERVKTSPYLFVGAGKQYSGQEAYAHLKMKYGFVRGRIQTAEESIDHIATRSSLSGKTYTVKIEERGSACQVHQSLSSPEQTT